MPIGGSRDFPRADRREVASEIPLRRVQPFFDAPRLQFHFPRYVDPRDAQAVRVAVVALHQHAHGISAR